MDLKICEEVLVRPFADEGDSLSPRNEEPEPSEVRLHRHVSGPDDSGKRRNHPLCGGLPAA